MPSHRAALDTPLEVLGSCNRSPKNSRLVCRFFLAHRVLRDFLPCQPAQPVFGCFSRIQGSKPKWTREGGVHHPNVNTRRHRSAMRRSAHVVVPTNRDNNLAIGRRTKLTPERSGAQPWMSGLLRARGLHGTDA